MNPLRFLFAALALSCCALAQPSEPRTEIPNAAQPQFATNTNGHVWLAYGQRTEASAAPAASASHAYGHGHGQSTKGNPPPPRSGDVFVVSSTDGGATFTGPVKVASLSKLMLGNRRGPRIAAHGGRVTVTVASDELIAFTSTDSGKTWSAPVTINDIPTSAREGLHDLAAAPDGRLFVTWLDLRNGRTELWSASSHDGGRTWTRNEPIYRSPEKSICECCHPSALFDADGNLAVMWRNSLSGSRDMWLTTRPKGATQFTAARKLGTGTWKLNACPMDGGRLVALGGGQFGAVWQRAGEVFLTRADNVEQSLGKGRQPVAVSLRDGDPLVVWQQGPDLVSLRKPRDSTPTKHATDARFPSVIALPRSDTILLAYEYGPAKGPTNIVIERLR